MKLRNQIWTGLLIGAMLMSGTHTTLYASEAENGTDPAAGAEVPGSETDAEVLSPEDEVALAYAAPVDSNGLEYWPQGPAIGGESGIVMDVNSGAILYAKGIDERHYPASITKVLTALVALENSQMTDKVHFTENSISFLEYGDAQIGMAPGEDLSMQDALYAVLLASANEVSYAVAESDAEGGYDSFIQKMNDKVKELGGVNSHFMNPHGLHDDNHYTCARDMALISSAAFQKEAFRNITKTLNYTIPPTNLQPEARIFQQNHKMLYPEHANYYEYCVGGKTGYTDQSLSTLVTFADNGVMQLVAVTLKTHGMNVYQDTRDMLDYVFSNFVKLPVQGNENSEDIEKVLDENAYVVVPNTFQFDQLDARIACSGTKDSNTGTVSYSYGGQFLGSAKIQASSAYFDKQMKSSSHETEKSAKKTIGQRAADLPKLLIALAVVAVLAAGVFTYAQIKRARARRERRNRRRMNRSAMGKNIRT